MKQWLCMCITTASIFGCSGSSPSNKPEPAPPPGKIAAAPERPQEKPPEAKPAPEEPMSEVKTAAEAREELQARIDRFFGGQPLDSCFRGTLGIWAVAPAFKIEKIEIIRVVQKYDKEGKIVPNQFVAVLKCDKVQPSLGQRESKDFAIDAFAFQDGEWQNPWLH